ncbi:MAG: hypothetical protein ASARMPREDX12_009323 [Alectoria sarmentosa]|nr:MAG: hypothetical protein ASARMPREDX12_009323 [Alectoria sarmentosa]
MAEGVKANPWSHITFPPQPAGPVLQPMQATTPVSSLPIRPAAATPGSTAAMARPDAQNARQSVFPVNINTITNVAAASPQGNTNHHRAPTTQLKRKRRVSDPADAVEIGAQRIRGYPRATATEHPYAPTGARVTEHPYAPTGARVTEHPYAPTSPPSVTEHPYAPTDPKITARSTSSPISVAVTTQDTEQEESPQDLSTVRFAPFGSIDYDLAIRTEDRDAWVQWANDLVSAIHQIMDVVKKKGGADMGSQHREIRSLRHIQDIGPYTTAVIAMMIEDGVWPRGDPVDLAEE